MADDRNLLLEALALADEQGDQAAVDSLTQELSAMEGRQGKGESAVQRFSQGAIASLASFGDLAQRLSGLPQQPLLEPAEEMGLTQPGAMQRTDFPSVLGKSVGTALPFAAAGPARAGLELGSAVGGAVGETVGREAGGPVGALAGGVIGSLASPLAFQAGRRVLTSPEGLRRNRELSDAAGTQLGLGEVGGTPIARYIERLSSRVPGGAQLSQARATRIGLQVATRARTLGERLARGGITPEVGGRALRRGFDNFVDTFRARSSGFYDELATSTGRDQISPVRYGQMLRQIGRESTATTQSAGGFAGATGNFVEDLTRRFAQDMQTTPQMTMGDLNSIRSRIGQEINDAALFGTPRQAIAKRLYGAITDDMRALAVTSDAAARRVNARPTALRSWQRANNFYRTGRERIDRLQREVFNRETDSKIFRAAFNSATTGPETIRAIKRSVSPQHYETALGITLQRMGLETPGVSTAVDVATEGWSLQRFLTNWNKINQAGTTSALLSGTSNRTLRQDLTQLARVSAGTRELMQTAANPSGTAQGLMGAGALAALGSGASLGFLTETLTALAGAGSAAIGGQLITSSPRFINWLATSTRIPVSQLPQHIEKLEKISQQEPHTIPIVKDILNQFGV